MTGWVASFVFLAAYLLRFFDLSQFEISWEVVLLVIGVVLGNLLPLIDAKFLHPLYGGVGHITKSLVFLGALMPVALFIVTSTGSELGIGLVMSFELLSTIKMLQVQSDSAKFQQTYLFQLARSLSQTEIYWVTSFQVVFVLILTILVLV